MTWAALGGRSLGARGARLAGALEAGDLDGARARAAVAVRPRSRTRSTRAELAARRVESVAENTRDAVVGALFWGARRRAGGRRRATAPPTRSTRWSATAASATRAFGWAAARLDDVAELARRARGRRARRAAARRSSAARRAATLARRAPRRRRAPEPERGPDRGGVRRRARRAPRRPARLRRPRRGPPDARRRPRARPRPTSTRAARLSRAVGAAAAALRSRAAALAHGDRAEEARREGRAARRAARTRTPASRSSPPASAAGCTAQGVRVAPFKAQNMALNSVVTPDGGEIGRAQAVQAAAAGLEPEAAMNPILIKPSGDRHSQVDRHGPARTPTPTRAPTRRSSTSCGRSWPTRSPTCARASTSSSARAPAARPRSTCATRDLTNMGLARAADLPVIVVADIDRGGVFASLFGTLALLDAADQAHVAGFVINKFRGDEGILAPGLDQLEQPHRPPDARRAARTSRTCGSTSRTRSRSRRRRAEAPTAGDTLDVAVVRLRWMSNFTDADALAAEPGVRVRFTRSPADVERADLVVVPGHEGDGRGPRAPARRRPRPRARGAGRRRRADPRHLRRLPAARRAHRRRRRVARAARSTGLGLLPVRRRFAPDKVLRRRAGRVRRLLDSAAGGYEIRHGRVERHGGERAARGRRRRARRLRGRRRARHLVARRAGARRASAARCSRGSRPRAGRRFVPGTTAFAAARARAPRRARRPDRRPSRHRAPERADRGRRRRPDLPTIETEVRPCCAS